jgi:membrane protein implicated in regulation of membrane protease activity
MAQSTMWWVLAGVVIGVELVTGTFYLLMVSIGLMAAALSAHLGASTAAQYVVAALIGGGSVVAWRAYKQQQPSGLPASANHNVNMDIGETVHVEAWNPDGTSSVKYRGAQWNVSIAPGDTPTPGLHTVIEVIGSRLVVKKS